MTFHREQLQSIHAMLAAGQRCVHLEPHSLLLWGLAGGGLCALTDRVIDAERFPGNLQRAVALLVWLAGWLGAVGWLDHRLTRRARQARHETMPFAQAQVMRAWWMLLAMGVLGTFAMFFHGGGGMIYALWTVLLGLGIFFFGLFSRPLIEWIGLATLLLGVAGLAAGLSMNTARWLTACCFAIGLPLAGWLSTRVDSGRTGARSLALTGWLAAVVVPALAVARTAPALAVPDPDTPILTLPAGTVVPLRVAMDGALVAVAPDAALPVRIARRIDVALTDGQPDGRFRFADGPWGRVGDGVLQLRIDRLQPRLEDGQPVIRAHGDFALTGGQP